MKTDKKDLSVLTPRELDVFQCIMRGFNNRRISENLGITYFTSKLVAGRVIKKLSCHSKNEVMAKFK
jgi:DNA-binding NarL/FixJ family response regulator